MTDERDMTRASPDNPVSKRGGGTPRAAENRNVVWSDNMLSALRRGVKGGKWFSLIDKVYAMPTLEEAFAQVQRNHGAPGCDHVTVERFAARLEEELEHLCDSLREEKYTPSPVRRREIPKGDGTTRPLGIPTIRDRVVQAAVRTVIEPIFEHRFHDNSFGFRPGRCCKDALRIVNRLLQEGYTEVIDADIKGYFDSIDHKLLMAEIQKEVADGKLLNLLKKFLKQPVLEEPDRWQPTEGTPQGAVISPLLANIFLNPLDHEINGLQDTVMVRYADDFVILCRSRYAADKALEQVGEWAKGMKLTLHPQKTQRLDMRVQGTGFDFLGYHFYCGKRRIRRRSSDKARKNLRNTIRKQTRRNNGRSLNTIIFRLNRSLRGWFEYFKHGGTTGIDAMDRLTRRRLRTIIRIRKKRRGMSRGRENREASNYFFARLGLFTLLKAFAEARQSVCR